MSFITVFREVEIEVDIDDAIEALEDDGFNLIPPEKQRESGGPTNVNVHDLLKVCDQINTEARATQNPVHRASLLWAEQLVRGQIH